ncbi:lysosomal dipeptide transporter MFSD1-like isoform X2 [Clytia hemisphaerica]|uniref:lysosomal dipeptide transporter MFSD1-like isoform X2 n=1 Tax=Clytia hemisphaerica TaxID=252671 RepID=UPI0034D4DDB8
MAEEINFAGESAHWCLNANKGYYRFLVLFFNCLLTFGSYFCFDMPSVLQDSFTGTYGINCTTNSHNVTKCEEHLGMTETEYNLLYTVYAWMNALVVIGSGIFIDKVGQRVGAVFFSALCVVGSAIFASGYFLKGRGSMLVLFLTGRLLFGAGNGSLTIAQNRISAYWFEGKELAFAFGATLSFSRLGSILNFFLTKDFSQTYGLKWTLWGGVFLCILGFGGALVLYVLDKNGMEQIAQREPGAKKSRKMKVGDIRHLSLQFVLLAVTTMSFYNTVFPFVADASQFIREKYHYSDDSEMPSYYAGSVYDVSLVATPILGIIVDYLGYRGLLAFVCAIFTIPVYLILAFTTWHPLYGTVLLGLTYSAAATSLWPSAPLVVNPGVLGTALGLMTSLQMIGIGVCSLVVGAILDKLKTNDHKWEYVMIFLLANAVLCVISALFLNIVDWRRSGILNKTRKRNSQKMKKLTDSREALVGDAAEGDGDSIN